MQDTNTCPVAHVARQLSQAIAASCRLDEEVLKAKGERERDATLERAQSPIGALMQVALASAEADRLTELADDDYRQEAKEHQRRIDRLLYSVIGFLEQSSGIRHEEVQADYFMDPDFDPHAAVERAITAAPATAS